MLTEDGFDALARAVAELNGLDIEQARRFVACVGDTPELDESGLVVVRDEEGGIIARLKWPMEGEE